MTDQLQRNILNQNNEVSRSEFSFPCLRQGTTKTFPPALLLFPGSARGPSLPEFSARLLAEHERKASYRLLPRQRGLLWGRGWCGDVNGDFWSKRRVLPPAAMSCWKEQILETLSAVTCLFQLQGRFSACEKPQVLQQDPFAGHSNSHWGRREGKALPSQTDNCSPL